MSIIALYSPPRILKSISHLFRPVYEYLAPFYGNIALCTIILRELLAFSKLKSEVGHGLLNMMGTPDNQIFVFND